MNRPLISVIITAFKKRTFLLTAIDSVLNQKTNISEYEIILVTTWDTSSLPDDVLNRVRIVTIKDDKEPINLINIGIKISRGEILCFLDDDDIFDENKLEIIKEIFLLYPSVGFVHNAFRLIDEDGKEINKSLGRYRYSSGKRDYFIRNRDVENKINKITSNEGITNASSISVRRSSVFLSASELSDLPGNWDGMIFCMCVKSGSDLFLYSKIMSSYRIHKQNNSKPQTYQALLYYLFRLKTSAEMIRLFLKDSEHHRLGDYDSTYWTIKENIATGKKKPSVGEIFYLFKMFINFGLSAYLSIILLYLFYFLTGKSYYKFYFNRRAKRNA